MNFNWDPFNSRKRSPSLKQGLNTLQKYQPPINASFKLFTRILKKSMEKTFRSHFNQLKCYAKTRQKIQLTMERLIGRNLNYCKIIAWEKLKENIVESKNNQRYLRSMFTLANRFYLQSMGNAFQSLYVYYKRERKNSIGSNFIFNARGSIILNAINHLIKNRKHLAIKKLNENRKKFIKLQQKLRIIATIRNSLQKNCMRRSFNKIMKVAYSQTTNKKIKANTNHLKHQVNDMKIQLQNKNQNIVRLKQQLKQIKQQIQQTEHNRNSNSRVSYRSGGGNLHRSGVSNNQSHDYSRKSSFDNKSHRSKDYSMMSRDQSIGSILNSSFMSFVSRGSHNALDSMIPDCHCSFRFKYYEYKSLHQTLKNQLDILKKELEVAKDLNQHFESQLKFYGEKLEDQQLEKIRLQVKEAQKDRDILRQKNFKYQKYIANLKVQLKQKMEQLYRKIKKNGVI